MLRIDHQLQLPSFIPIVERFFSLSAQKLSSLQKSWDTKKGSPVFTVQGIYTSRGWTEWTQGFQHGSAVLQYDATGDKEFLNMGREGTLREMSRHVSHVGVHDHGFNTISTFGNLLRLVREKRIPFGEWEKNFYELAIEVSGAVQAARWTQLGDNQGYIYSFNGPHSLFSDTIRSLRVLAVAHQLGHVLMGEKDRRINLLERFLQHAETTARYNVYFGEGRDLFDVRGRVAHESIFNTNDGSYRSPSTQQGYSPFSTWTRGLAWILLGYAEELEFLSSLSEGISLHSEDARKYWRRFRPLQSRWRTSTSRTLRATAFLTGTPARQGCRSWVTILAVRLIRSMIMNPSTVRQPRSQRRAWFD